MPLNRRARCSDCYRVILTELDDLDDKYFEYIKRINGRHFSHSLSLSRCRFVHVEEFVWAIQHRRACLLFCFLFHFVIVWSNVRLWFDSTTATITLYRYLCTIVSIVVVVLVVVEIVFLSLRVSEWAHYECTLIMFKPITVWIAIEHFYIDRDGSRCREREEQNKTNSKCKPWTQNEMNKCHDCLQLHFD